MQKTRTPNHLFNKGIQRKIQQILIIDHLANSKLHNLYNDSDITTFSNKYSTFSHLLPSMRDGLAKALFHYRGDDRQSTEYNIFFRAVSVCLSLKYG